METRLPASRWLFARGDRETGSSGPVKNWRERVDAAFTTSVSLCAAGFFALLVAGVVRWYSPAPLADSWDGSLNFYLRLLDGRTDQWLSPSNEHRLIFSRFLFWIDHRYFGGLQRFLTVMNIALVTACWGAFSVAAFWLFPKRKGRWKALALLGVCCFSWDQSRNLTWAYQSQFFAAYLFPLAALLGLARASAGPGRATWTAIAAVFAALSATSMANGILAAPLLAGMALVDAPRRVLRWSMLSAVAVIVPWLYLLDYAPRPTPPAQPLEVLVFTLEFLGAPLKHVFGDRSLAIGGGAVIAAIGAFGAWAWMRQRPSRDPWLLALLFLLVYIGASGGAAGYRRAGMEPDGGSSVRYATAALMAWSAAILIVLRVARDTRFEVWTFWLIGAGLLACLAPLQLSAIDYRGPMQVRSQQLAVLALDLGLYDPKSARLLYPNQRFLPIAAEARELNVGVFGLPEMVLARQALGRSVDELGFTRCDGRVFVREPLASATDGMLVRGWAYDRIEGRSPEQLFFVDPRGVVVGAGFTGRPRADSYELVGRADELCDFDGYVVVQGEQPLELFHRPLTASTIFPEVRAGERK